MDSLKFSKEGVEQSTSDGSDLELITNSSSNEEDEENISSDDDDEAEHMRKELADIPLGELQKLKETVGLKRYSEAVFGLWKPQTQPEHEESADLLEKAQDSSPVSTRKGSIKKSCKKKSEPEERSSKIRKFQPRKIVENNKRLKRDPRFDDLSGKLNQDLFQKSYRFVDDIKKDELHFVKKQFKKVKNKARKAELHRLLQRMEQQNQMKASEQHKKLKDRERKKEALDSVQKGKKAFFLKNSDKKKIELAEKYKELKTSGQLEKYLSKKRKRNAAKEKKKLPYMKNDK